jgi:hypothetical protein|uniref:Tail protein n=1 Tax=virus sp. ctmTa7 TaxID=2828255 RepID=A0A8S5RC35_9VIRU|nr:MAG TPA: tail protein [virus sp. ctmTa7]
MAVYLGENKVCTKGGTKVLLSDISLQDKTVTPSTSIQTIKADNNYDGLSSVTVNAINTVTQATPSISISNSGLITASSTQSAGYVTSGTKNSTKQLTTKSTTTITPSTFSQTIASGTYLTGTQTIKGDSNLIAENIKNGTSIFGVTGTYVGSGSGSGVDTSDATATSSDIAEGKTSYVNGKKITGTVKEVKSNYSDILSNATITNDGADVIKFNFKRTEDVLCRIGSWQTLKTPLTNLGDATTADVAAGKTFTSAAGIKVTGTGIVQSTRYTTGQITGTGTTNPVSFDTGLTSVEKVIIIKDSFNTGSNGTNVLIWDGEKARGSGISTSSYLSNPSSSAGTFSTNGGTVTYTATELKNALFKGSTTVSSGYTWYAFGT